MSVILDTRVVKTFIIYWTCFLFKVPFDGGWLVWFGGGLLVWFWFVLIWFWFGFLYVWFCFVLFHSSEKPTEVVKQLEDKTAAAGQDISLSCELSKPDATIRWYKDGKAIRKSQKYDLHQEGTRATLIIHESTVKDSGEYTCETEVSKTKARITVQGQQKHA